MKPLLAALLLLAACRTAPEHVDRDRAEEIPRESALAFLVDLERQGGMSMVPSERGLTTKPRRGDGVLTPYEDWTFVQATMTKVLNEGVGEVWLESRGRRTMLYGERAARAAGREQVRARLRRVLQALAALGVKGA